MSQNKEISMFEVGQHVICVDDGRRSYTVDWRGQEVTQGRIYTVGALMTHPTEDVLLVNLQEKNPFAYWAADRFRPLPSSQISLINSMLVTELSKERA